MGYRAVQTQTMTQTSSQHRIGIVIPNQCSLLTLGAITEPFTQVNQILGEEKYQLVYVAEKKQGLITLSGSPLPMTVVAQAGLEEINDYDAIIVIADQLPKRTIKASTKKALLTFQQQTSKSIITLQAGWHWLLESGIGHNDNWAIHWRWEDTIKLCYPALNVRYEGHRKSSNIISCANASESLHAVLSYLARYEDNVTVRAISDELYIEGGSSAQSEGTELNAELPPRLQKAISLMESNLEEPISADMIADLVHVSRRQLERLFKRYLDTMPARYYLQLRLKNAQHLLQTTNHSVVQIGLMCGFSSGPHFSSAYKQYFEITPREERAKRFYATKA